MRAGWRGPVGERRGWRPVSARERVERIGWVLGQIEVVVVCYPDRQCCGSGRLGHPGNGRIRRQQGSEQGGSGL